MEDKEIIALFFQRSEKAIEETKNKYEKYCYRIAYNILYNNEDSEECVNDTYMKAWNAIPPTQPIQLSAFLGCITRNLALHIYKKKNSLKHGKGQVNLVYDELQEVISNKDNPEEKVQVDFVASCITDYLKTLSKQQRMIFIGRYWGFESVEDIANHLGITKSKVKTTLFRTRNGLKEYLTKEGIVL